jgi:hypothetical protein
MKIYAMVAKCAAVIDDIGIVLFNLDDLALPAF